MGKKTISNSIYGYARISTKKQSIERQERNILAAYPSAVIVKEVYTGTTTQRPAFERLLKQLHAGDTVIFDSVSRFSRDAQEGFSLYEELYQKGINLVYLKEPQINTDTYKKALAGGVALTGTNADYILEGVNKYLLALAKEQIKLAFDQAEKEVQDLRQRTKEGLQTAKLNGKQVGQVEGAKYHVKKSDAAKAIIRKHSADFEGTLNDTDTMKLAGVSRNTYYAYKRELKEGR